jgi:hypothetical protein
LRVKWLSPAHVAFQDTDSMGKAPGQKSRMLAGKLSNIPFGILANIVFLSNLTSYGNFILWFM